MPTFSPSFSTLMTLTHTNHSYISYPSLIKSIYPFFASSLSVLPLFGQQTLLFLRRSCTHCDTRLTG